MRIIIKSDDLNRNIVIPNALVLNKLSIKLLSSSFNEEIDTSILKDLLNTVKLYLKSHPKFEFLEVITDDTYIKITF